MEAAKSPSAFDLLPDEIKSLPKIEIPVSGVTGYSLTNDEKQLVFFVIEEGVSVPNHAHCAQRGTVVSGEMTLTIEGQTNLYQPGDTYTIPGGATHRASFSKDTILIDLFDAPDRYPIRA
jgi:quercetin dioxygenase-like cupin family protein